MRARRVEGRFDPDAGSGSAAGTGGAVASAFRDATDAGVEILEDGGNAIDAACAVGLALGVCEPQASGLGGQSVAVIHHEGRTFTLDGSSRVPSLAHHERFGRGQRRTGYRATTVPSTPAFYGWMNDRYGALPWRRVLEPAIRIARDGYEITQLQHDLQARESKRMLAVPSRSGARYFLDADDSPYAVGQRFRQPDLARTLEHLAEHGPDSFYQGEIAAQIDADMRANDGFLRADDLALVPLPIERPVVRRRYRGVTLATMPPPGAGRILLLVMLLLQRFEPDFLAEDSARRHHVVAEAMRKAFLRRLDRPYDPNTYEQMTDRTLLSRRYVADVAASIAETIDPTLPLVDPHGESEEDLDPERGETTHFSVMDDAGGTVAVTQSIELTYGSAAAADDLGFLYNNYLLALELENPAHPYFLRPAAVPWSTAAPTIAFREGKPWLALGSPGSERIFSAIAQTLVHVVDGSRPLDQAVAAPRLHASIGGRISYESGRFAPETLEHLERAGYQLDERERRAFYLGCVQATLRCQTQPGFQATADPRRDGTARTGGPLPS